MTVHDTPEAEPPDAQQRKRIEAMTQDPTTPTNRYRSIFGYRREAVRDRR